MDEKDSDLAVSKSTARMCLEFLRTYKEELASSWIKHQKKSGADPDFSWMQVNYSRIAKKDYHYRYLHKESNALAHLFQLMPQVVQWVEDAALAEKVAAQKKEAELLSGLDRALDKHGFIFFRNYRNCYVKDDYGNVVKDGRDEEILKIMKSVGYSRYDAWGLSKALRKKTDVWFKAKYREIYLEGLPPDDGVGFEFWVAEQLKKFGWETFTTKASGDNGIDVIAKKSALSAGIQCKRYNGSVGNKAVQEAIAGSQYMMLQFACVVTTGTFTKAAKDLAEATGVVLLSANDLKDLEAILLNVIRTQSK